MSCHGPTKLSTELTNIGHFLENSIVLYCIFAIILSTFRLFKGQQYLNNMLRINTCCCPGCKVDGDFCLRNEIDS